MAKAKKKSLSYKDAGVDITAGNNFVELIGKHVKKTHGKNVINIHNGFAGAMSLFGKGAKQYKDPVMLSCTDGVGTKLKMAFVMDKHDTVGIDLVAMSVNDLIVHGAAPMFFLDYMATGKLEPAKMADVVKGISDGCLQSSAALIGGETAEMPDFYKKGEYDLAGFAVGIVERSRMLLGDKVKEGDVIIGLPSSGLHSNGFSLARKALGTTKAKLNKYSDELGCTVGEALIEPTRIYVKPIMDLLDSYKTRSPIHALSHITGGGLLENIPRVLPKGCKAVINSKAIDAPPIFEMIKKAGNIAKNEMYRTFNMGVGFTVVVSPSAAKTVVKRLQAAGEDARVIGEIQKGRTGVTIK